MKQVKIIYFYANWSGPALRLKALFSQLKPVKEYPIEIHYLNADKRASMKKKYRVKLIPTTIFLQKGRETSRIEGAWHLNKYQETLLQSSSRGPQAKNEI